MGLILPWVNKHTMLLHMQEISKAVPKDRHAVVDGALWHQPSLNQSNVTMLKLPPYSPELNPSEGVWQYLKQNELSNRCYEDYESIVDAACSAWNKLLEQPKRIRSLTTRVWAQL